MITKTTTTTTKLLYNWNKDQKAQILEVGFISPFGRVDLRNYTRQRKSEAFGTINSKKKPTSDWMKI